MQNLLGEGGIVAGFSNLVMNHPATSSQGMASPSSPSGANPQVSSATSNDVVFASFNQDTTSLAVGTPAGYRLYSLCSTDSLEPLYENNTESGVYIAERLFSSSLVAIVSNDSPRKLKLCHFKKGTEICNYKYTSKVLAVRLNRARLIVCLEESLYIHNIRDMKVLHTIRETPPNKGGLCALSADSDNCYLAYPGHSSVGELQIFDALNLASMSMIPAHTGQLAAIQFSPTGTGIATASDKGTVIRIFNVADGARIYELRRGLKRTATIHSLSFSPCGLYLACSSNTETIHVFKLDATSSKEIDTGNSSPPGSGTGASSGFNPDGSTTDGSVAQAASASSGDGSWMGYFSNVVSVSANYLPSQVTDTLLQGRAFATVHHNLYGFKNICGLAMIKKTLRLLLTSDNGYLYIYSLDMVEGGDCHMIRQFHLTNSIVSEQQTAGHSARRVSESSTGSEKPQQQENPVKPTSEEISYADRLRNRHPADMSDSEKFHEMALATESPPKQCFLLDDDGDFPPIGGNKSDAAD